MLACYRFTHLASCLHRSTTQQRLILSGQPIWQRNALSHEIHILEARTRDPSQLGPFRPPAKTHDIPQKLNLLHPFTPRGAQHFVGLHPFPCLLGVRAFSPMAIWQWNLTRSSTPVLTLVELVRLFFLPTLLARATGPPQPPRDSSGFPKIGSDPRYSIVLNKETPTTKPGQQESLCFNPT